MQGPPTLLHRDRKARTGRTHVLLVLMLLVVPSLTTVVSAVGPGTETVFGVVYDEQGLPMEGAQVRAEGKSLLSVTDAGGRFLLTSDGLDGNGTLVVSASGYLTARVPYVLEDCGSVERSIYMVEERALPGCVEGHVRAFGVIPVSGAKVFLEGNGMDARGALTDGDGHFRFLDVQPFDDPYTLTAEASGHITHSIPVTVEPNRTTSQDIAVVPIAPMELLYGYVTDAQDSPLPGVEVEIEGTSVTWTTDMEGYFSALLDGRLERRNVTLSLEGYATERLTLDIPPPGVQMVEVAMEESGEGGRETLWVQVLDTVTGTPLEGVSVTILGSDTPWTTGPNGIVIILADGLDHDVHITATMPGYTIATVDTTVVDGATRSVKLYITRSSNYVALDGTVRDEASEEPISDARVRVFANGVERFTLTDKEGMFHVHNLPPDVMAKVTVEAEGYLSASVEVHLLELLPNHLVLPLEREQPKTFTVMGWVREVGTQEPVVGARVSLWMNGFRVLVISDRDGKYLVEGIPLEDAQFEYRVDHRAYSERGGIMTHLEANEVRQIATWLKPLPEPMSVIQGYVADPNGFTVDGADVVMTIGSTKYSTWTLDGMYELYVPLEESTMVEMSAEGEGYGWHNQTPMVHPWSANWVNFSIPLGPGYSNILGTVVTQNGRPVEGAEVHLTYKGAYHSVGTTDRTGAYAFRLVPSITDSYELSAVIEGFNGITVPAMAYPGTPSVYRLVVAEDIISVETLRGTVVSGSGLPMASVAVAVGDEWATVTDANGSFVLVSQDLDGRWAVSAAFPGFMTATEVVEVPPDATVEVDLVLSVMDERVSIVRGTVVRATNGEPMPGATVRLGWSGSSSWTFETGTDGEGDFTFRGVPKAWGGIVVTVSADGHHDEPVHASLADVEGTWLTFTMRPLEPEPADRPVMTETQARQVGVGVGVTVATIAAIMLTEVGRVALLTLLLLPLYTKIKREKVMDHFIRGRIYEYICQNPGVNYSAIKQKFKLTNGTVTYHLSMLERQEFIRSKQDGIYKRYFANNGGPGASEVEPMSLQLSIAKAIRERPGMTQKEIAKRLGSSKQLVSYHVRKMYDEGQLETRRDGRSVRVFPNPRTPE